MRGRTVRFRMSRRRSVASSGSLRISTHVEYRRGLGNLEPRLHWRRLLHRWDHHHTYAAFGARARSTFFRGAQRFRPLHDHCRGVDGSGSAQVVNGFSGRKFSRLLGRLRCDRPHRHHGRRHARGSQSASSASLRCRAVDAPADGRGTPRDPYASPQGVVPQTSVADQRAPLRVPRFLFPEDPGPIEDPRRRARTPPLQPGAAEQPAARTMLGAVDPRNR
jgi:hypothetical protein